MYAPPNYVIGQDGRYYVAWPTAWSYHVGQAAPATFELCPQGSPGFGRTYSPPEWQRERALARSAIEALMRSDRVFDEIYRHIVQYLAQQGQLRRPDAAYWMRKDVLDFHRNWIRSHLSKMNIGPLLELGLQEYLRARLCP